jgi:hypothetical protein
VLASPIDTHYCKAGETDCSYQEAYDFVSWDDLTPTQLGLLGDFLQKTGGNLDPRTLYRRWTEDFDDRAASFLSLTLALSRLMIDLPSHGGYTGADVLLRELTQIDGDRIYCVIDPALLAEWRAGGAKFRLERVDGKVETGDFGFDHGDLGGSLHKGFEIQAYTSIRKEPRIQINYRSSDHLADIDLDLAPWIWGFIPNPVHMTYLGSDSRQWLPLYEKKYGNPGFTVRKRSSSR